jgi:hypothetical protein
MAQKTQRYAFGGGTAIALVGLALLIASFAVLMDGSDGLLAINAPPLLFISAVLALRIGVLMSERYGCSACGESVARTTTQCPACEEPLFG